MAADDTEITLGTGKLLGLFLMLAATCGIFFAVGYSLGKTSAREQALQSANPQADPADRTAELGRSPGAVTAPSARGATQDAAGPAKESEPDLTFYNAVKQDSRQSSDSTPELRDQQQARSDQSHSKTANKTEPANPGATETMPAPARSETATASFPALPQASTGGAYLVQIAAVSHEEDAAALAGALRKKSYAASVVNSPNGKDKFFHVVLGPYASLQDAEAMKAKLQGEGYSPIIKR